MLQIPCVPRKKKEKEKIPDKLSDRQTGLAQLVQLRWCVGSKSSLCVALSVPLPVGGTWSESSHKPGRWPP